MPPELTLLAPVAFVFAVLFVDWVHKRLATGSSPQDDDEQAREIRKWLERKAKAGQQERGIRTWFERKAKAGRR